MLYEAKEKIALAIEQHLRQQHLIHHYQQSEHCDQKTCSYLSLTPERPAILIIEQILGPFITRYTESSSVKRTTILRNQLLTFGICKTHFIHSVKHVVLCGIFV